MDFEVIRVDFEDPFLVPYCPIVNTAAARLRVITSKMDEPIPADPGTFPTNSDWFGALHTSLELVVSAVRHETTKNSIF